MRRLLYLLELCILTACAGTPENERRTLDLLLEATTVPKSYPVAAPANIQELSAELVACVGTAPIVSLAAVTFREIDVTEFSFLGESHMAGWSNVFFHQITIAKPYWSERVLLKHELLHTQYNLLGHPEPFQRCGLMEPIAKRDSTGVVLWYK